MMISSVFVFLVSPTLLEQSTQARKRKTASSVSKYLNFFNALIAAGILTYQNYVIQINTQQISETSYADKSEIRTFPIMAKIPTIYIFEIQLDDAMIPVWRILEVPRTITLHELHLCIQVALGWECRHLYEFFFREKRYEIPEPMTPVDDEIKDPRVVKLMELDLELGESFSYTYDFGDGWQHTVTFKGYSRKEYGFKHLPRCTSGAMACPPEDIGGIPVYNELIDFLVNKQPMTILPDLEKYFKKFDPWNEAPTNDYFFASEVRTLGKMYK